MSLSLSSSSEGSNELFRKALSLFIWLSISGAFCAKKASEGSFSGTLMALLTLQSSALVKLEKAIFDEMQEMQKKGTSSPSFLKRR